MNEKLSLIEIGLPENRSATGEYETALQSTARTLKHELNDVRSWSKENVSLTKAV